MSTSSIPELRKLIEKSKVRYIPEKEFRTLIDALEIALDALEHYAGDFPNPATEALAKCEAVAKGEG